MVHRMDSVEEFPTRTKLCRRKVKVKSEFEDSANDDYGSVSKKPKFDSSNEENNGDVGVLEYDPFEEPSPLGLKLKKSPSFLDLIQMRLSQEKSASLSKTLARKQKAAAGAGAGASSTAADTNNNNNNNNNHNNNNNNKLKASNFPASLLKIGTWEYKSRYEGDLVAKCYFAKHKLVWEVLDGGLKNKIEIQWSDIMGIKANYPDNEPGTLDIVLGRQPSFFREINPQPRKHTLWQATTDFTCGQASLYRRHFLQFPQGTLGKHFQKLIQCDPRLSFLSQQPEILLETPYFQPRVSIFGDQSDPGHGLEFKTEGRFSFSGIRDTISVSGLSSSDIESQNPIGATKNSQLNSQPIPGMYAMEGDVSSRFNETHGLEILSQIKLPGLHPSMSVGDLVNHIGDCISEQMRSESSNLSIDETQKSEVLKEITHYLLNDSQSSIISDEKSIMSRVNSLCCLLQKEDTGVQYPATRLCEDQTTLSLVDVDNNSHVGMNLTNMSYDQTAKTLPAVGSETGSSIDSQQATGMSRNDSVDELLLTLPRIASLPQFLIPEESATLVT